jgi:hypothetical protein
MLGLYLKMGRSSQFIVHNCVIAHHVTYAIDKLLLNKTRDKRKELVKNFFNTMIYFLIDNKYDAETG